MNIPTTLRDVLDRWGPGQLMAFSGLDGRTDYGDGIVARTSRRGTGFEVMLPGRADVVLSDVAPTRCFLTGDVLQAETTAGPVTAAFLDAHHLLVRGACRASAMDPLVTVLSVGDRTLVASTRYVCPACLNADLDAAVRERLRWLDAQRLPSDMDTARRRTLTKALSVMKTQVYTPEGAIRHRWTTPDRWPHRNQWLWDSAFHAIGWRHLDPALARETIEAVTDRQCADGRIPISVPPYGNDTKGLTQPPVLTLAAWMVDQAKPDDAWMSRLYPALCRYVEWDLANRDTDGAGLLEWAVEDKATCRCGESGWDNSTRFDSGAQLDAPDFNAMAALECELLGRLAARLGRPREEQDLWHDRHQRLCRLLNERLWSRSNELYMDATAGSREHTGVLSEAGFLPLICRAPSRRQADQLAAHLRNPATFGAPLPVPSIAPRSSSGYAKDMWRGPVWVNVNWLIVLGLRLYGLDETADALRRATLAEIERQYERHGVIFEFYDDERRVDPPDLDRKGPCNPDEWLHQVVFDYGWTAALYLDGALGRMNL